MAMYTSKMSLSQEAGLTVVVENTSAQMVSVEIDMSDCSNMVSTRGSFIVQDVIAPGKRQVVIVVAPQPQASRYGLSLAFNSGISMGPACQFPPVDEDVYMSKLHMPLSIPIPSEAQQMQNNLAFILQALAAPQNQSAPIPPAPLNPLPAPVPGPGSAASEPMNVDEDDEIEAAIRLSKMPFDQGTPTAEPVSEDDELAAAIALSMEEDGGPSQAPAATGDTAGGGADEYIEEDAELAAAIALSMQDDPGVP
mmetsp:Transcript_80532/g.141858  ORF Transcript_80532/g.141858 Transcript_80532/m.141858 type:complete len:252 (+) Transcript_80532:2262-3017(+)